MGPNGDLAACTRMMCFDKGEAKCNEPKEPVERPTPIVEVATTSTATTSTKQKGKKAKGKNVAVKVEGKATVKKGKKNGKKKKIPKSHSAFIALGVASGSLLMAFGNMKVVRDRENRENAQSAAVIVAPIPDSNSGPPASNSFDLENERNAITIPTTDSTANQKVVQRTTVDVTDSGTTKKTLK